MDEDLDEDLEAFLEGQMARGQTQRIILRDLDAGSMEDLVSHLEAGHRASKEFLSLSAVGDIAQLVAMAQPLESEAQLAGISSVFDDGGYRTLLICKLFGLRAVPGKGGDDATDAHGRNFELKTINLLDTQGRIRKSLGVTTEHTLRQTSIDRYRRTDGWIIGVFSGSAPVEFWQVPTIALEPFFKEWEQKLASAPSGEINNPKIPLRFVTEVGVLVHQVRR